MADWLAKCRWAWAYSDVRVIRKTYDFPLLLFFSCHSHILSLFPLGSCITQHHAILRSDSAGRGTNSGDACKHLKKISMAVGGYPHAEYHCPHRRRNRVGDQAAKIWADAHPLITGLAVPAVMTLAILVLSEPIPTPGG